MENPFNVDITNPVCPETIMHHLMADQVRDLYIQYRGTKPHPLLKEFLDSHPEGLAFEWQNAILKECLDAPLELVARWLDVLPSCFFRAELRADYKRRLLEEKLVDGLRIKAKEKLEEKNI